MKVLLIWPIFLKKPKLLQPLGLAYIASCLEKVGHNVKIIDPTIEKKSIGEVEKEIKKYDPDALGVSSNTETIYDLYGLNKFAKRNNPNCKTIIGGPHATALPVETLKECPYIDIVVRGEGELTIVELLEGKDYDNIKGITFRKDKKIINNPDRALINNLDELPFPAYHLLPMKKYLTKEKELYSSISTSRGCPYNCIFCASSNLWGRKWRAKSPSIIIDEIKLLFDKYKIKKLYFIDDLSTASKKRMVELCNLLKKEKIDIEWECSSRVNLIDYEICKVMKKAGCKTVGFGIESGNQKTLDFFNKGITINQAIDAVKTAKKTGLYTDSNFILGAPFETKKMLMHTIKFSQNIGLTFIFYSILTPLPGSKMYEIAKKEDLLLTKDWSKYKSYNPVMKIEHVTTNELKLIYMYAYFRKKILRK